jgi:hypothetical protein
MKTICWFEDVFRRDTREVWELQEKDLHGRDAGSLGGRRWRRI